MKLQINLCALALLLMIPFTAMAQSKTKAKAKAKKEVAIQLYSVRDIYKRQNKMFHFHKTFCSKFSFINTKQNVHFIPFEYALNEIKASNTANS